VWKLMWIADLVNHQVFERILHSLVFLGVCLVEQCEHLSTNDFVGFEWIYTLDHRLAAD